MADANQMLENERLAEYELGQAVAFEAMSALAKQRAGEAFSNYQDEKGKWWRDLSKEMADMAAGHRKKQKEYAARQ